MLSRRFLIAHLILLFQVVSGAQETQRIKGVVTDSESSFPLIGATVEILGLGVGTTTSEDGFFTLSDVAIGRIDVRVSYLGYEDATRSNVLVTSGKEVWLEIQLVERIAALNEVVVRDQSFRHKTVNDLATVSARTFSMDEAARYSGSFGDPARMAQSYAGVSGASDDRNDIIIRGNSPTGVLWRMEGVDILSPNHFATLGTTGGPVSMLNVNNLQNSDFLTSAFPAEYGNATSGVFDLRLRNGNTDRYEFLGQVGFNGFEGGVEGPLGFGKNSSFVINGRYSTLGVFGALGIDFGTGSAIPEYQDVTFKVNVPTSKLGKFALWGFGGSSDIAFLAEENGGNNLYNEDDENATFSSKTATVGLTHTYFHSDRALTQLSLTYSASAIGGIVEEFDPTSDLFVKDYEQDFRQDKIGLNLKYNIKINAREKITAGAILDVYGLNVEDSVRLNNGAIRNNINFEGEVTLWQGYVNWQHRFNDRLTLNTGLHTQWLTLNNSFAIEPRLGFEFAQSDVHTFTVGAGLHSQTQPIPIYAQIRKDAEGNVVASNEDLDFFKSAHVAAGWNWLFAPSWRLKSEVYYQRLSDLAVDRESSAFSMVNSGADFGFPDRIGLDNDGTGRNYGIEFTLEKFFSEGLYLLTTASIFDSRYRGSDGVLRNTLFNSNYVFNVLAGREFTLSPKWTLTVDTKVTYSGGRRYTPFDVEESLRQGREVLIRERTFEEKLPSYFRPDLKLGFRLNGAKSTQTFFIDLTNFVGNRNVFERDLDLITGAFDDTYQRGFFPDVRYQIVF
ncbi:MAG: TonB-dependent receptor [Saprospiraceae bacterium]|nr:TonB-dependent receptor [Saprospiraceae bacterium]